MDSKLAVVQESDIKAKHCVPVFCVFELYQFEREQNKNINKISLEKFDSTDGNYLEAGCSVTKASPDQWAMVVGGP